MIVPVKIDCDLSKVLAKSHTIPSAERTVFDKPIYQQMIDRKDIYDKFGGFPHSYCEKNTQIHQVIWNKKDLDWELLGLQLNMHVMFVTSIMQEPGNILPLHRDGLVRLHEESVIPQKVLERLGIDTKLINQCVAQSPSYDGQHKTALQAIWDNIATQRRVRANIFLEDAKLGHFFQCLDGDNITSYTDWKKNSGLIFDCDLLHLSCNAGLEPKFTLQVSGLFLG